MQDLLNLTIRNQCIDTLSTVIFSHLTSWPFHIYSKLEWHNDIQSHYWHKYFDICANNDALHYLHVCLHIITLQLHRLRNVFADQIFGRRVHPYVYIFLVRAKTDVEMIQLLMGRNINKNDASKTPT